MCLVFFIRIIKDDDLAVARRLEDVAVEITKKFLASSAPREVSTMKFSSSEDEERSIIGAFLEALPCSNTGEQGQRDETSDRDLGGGEDPNGTGDGVLLSLGR
jgi:hypothetical protein